MSSLLPRWRKGEQLESEGFSSFRAQFGDTAYALHHRFYMHLDRGNQFWLSAEDGCEGKPAAQSAYRQFYESVDKIRTLR